MDKRYQVFVSSTYRDLQDERAEVIRALLELDCIPAGMELFPASDETQWELIKRVIDDCDYYVVVIGGRYGATDEEGVSYTEKEYDYAVSRGIPVLAFPVEDPDAIPAGKVEISEQAQAKLRAFRDKATRKKMAKFWTSPEDLGGKVSRSISQLMKIRPAEGWVKARYAGDSEALLKLRSRIEELEEQLEMARTRPPEGAEELAQGAQEISIGYDVTFGQAFSRNGQFTISWDQAIEVLGPLMFDECSESRLSSTLSCYVARHVPLHEYESLHVHQESFQTVKVQLMALGIIQKSQRKRTPSDRETYWSLSPYGEHYVTKLKAIRRIES